uniref:Uncharacterized protein n=1 Tax=Compsopogon caeruleus TaxID=31354 RepID=A0A7S1XH19_9RHOD
MEVLEEQRCEWVSRLDEDVKVARVGLASWEEQWRSAVERLHQRHAAAEEARKRVRDAQRKVHESIERTQRLVALQVHLEQYANIAKLAVLDVSAVSHAELPQIIAELQLVMEQNPAGVAQPVLDDLREKQAVLVAERDGALLRKLRVDEASNSIVMDSVSEIKLHDERQIVQLVERLRSKSIVTRAIKYANWMSSDLDSDQGTCAVMWSFEDEEWEQMDQETKVTLRMGIIFDLLAKSLCGLSDRVNDILALSFQQWLVDDVFETRFFFRGEQNEEFDGDFVGHLNAVPWRLTRQRLEAAQNACINFEQEINSRTLEHPISLAVMKDPEVLEKKIGLDIRAQVLLRARHAISNFVNKNEEHVLVAPTASAFRPKSDRGPLWFPSCLVTASACDIMNTAKDLLPAAVEVLKGGSTTLANAMVSAAKESLDAFRNDIPLEHADDFGPSIRLRVLFHNDCMMLGFMASNIGATIRGAPPSLVKAYSGVAIKLRSSAAETISEIINETRLKMEGFLRIATENQALGETGTVIGRRRTQSAISKAFNSLRETVVVFAGFLPAEEGQSYSLSLLGGFLDHISFAIMNLLDISTGASECLIALIGDTLNNCTSLQELILSMGHEGASEPIASYKVAEKRARALQSILDLRMEDIVTRYKEGEFDGMFTRQNIEVLILAIFEDTDLRKQFIEELDIKEEEGWNW